jgi:hypothetical protein
MVQCCSNSFQICPSLLPCAESFWIKVPIGYEGEPITIRIEKQSIGYIYQTMLEVDAEGFIEVPVSDFPSGYFNQYGGPYIVSFYGVDFVLASLNFVATDGKIYDSIIFEIQSGTPEQVQVINAINDQLPSF